MARSAATIAYVFGAFSPQPGSAADVASLVQQQWTVQSSADDVEIPKAQLKAIKEDAAAEMETRRVLPNEDMAMEREAAYDEFWAHPDDEKVAFYPRSVKASKGVTVCSEHADCTHDQYCADELKHETGRWSGRGVCRNGAGACCAEGHADPVDRLTDQCPTQSKCKPSVGVLSMAKKAEAARISRSCTSHTDCDMAEYCRDNGKLFTGIFSGVGVCSTRVDECCSSKAADPVDRDPSRCPPISRCAGHEALTDKLIEMRKSLTKTNIAAEHALHAMDYNEAKVQRTAAKKLAREIDNIEATTAFTMPEVVLRTVMDAVQSNFVVYQEKQPAFPAFFSGDAEDVSSPAGLLLRITSTMAPLKADVKAVFDKHCTERKGNVLMNCIFPFGTDVSFQWLYDGLNLQPSDKLNFKLSYSGRHAKDSSIFEHSCNGCGEACRVNTDSGNFFMYQPQHCHEAHVLNFAKSHVRLSDANSVDHKKTLRKLNLNGIIDIQRRGKTVMELDVKLRGGTMKTLKSLLVQGLPHHAAHPSLSYLEAETSLAQ